MVEEPGAASEGDSAEPGGPAGAGHEEEPVTTGTLFIMLIFLMALAALWAIMYLTLLER
ncbi:MAG: hypothetical protein KAJ67_09640 [Gemmatimonadetes bacterium]|nr:hypothetical protein [Gemmatimonadota bacterium]